jgi:hypothetical protein
MEREQTSAVKRQAGAVLLEHGPARERRVPLQHNVHGRANSVSSCVISCLENCKGGE